MKLKKLEDLKKGDTVLLETENGLETQTVDEIDFEDGTFISETMLNVYPDEETDLYVVLEGDYS